MKPLMAIIGSEPVLNFVRSLGLDHDMCGLPRHAGRVKRVIERRCMRYIIRPMRKTLIIAAALAAGMTLEEAIVASTVNAAFALDRWEEAGSLEEGKKMDALILGGDDPACLMQVGISTIDTVIKNGKLVVEGGRLVRESSKKGSRD